MAEQNDFDLACQHFDRGEYFEAHEVWEDLWNEASGPRHAYLQGLIQVAVALHHAGNANWNGTRKLLASALAYLEKGSSAADEIDVAEVREKVLEFELALQGHLIDSSVTLPFFLLPRKK